MEKHGILSSLSKRKMNSMMIGLFNINFLTPPLIGKSSFQFQQH